MLSWSYKVGFLGIILLWEICLNRTGAGVNATPMLNRQGGNVLVAAPYSVEFIFQNHMALTSVALVARPCAPVAQRDEDSSSSRSRLAKSYGRFAPLNLRQDCFFRVSLPKCQSSYSPPAADKLISSTHPFTEKLRSDSFQKLRMTKIEEPLKKMHRIF